MENLAWEEIPMKVVRTRLRLLGGENRRKEAIAVVKVLACYMTVLYLMGCSFDASGVGGSAPGLAAGNSHGCACECVASQAYPVSVGVASDDACEFADGSVVLDGTSLAIAQNGSDPNLVGLRFDQLGLSGDAVVEEAYVQFTSAVGNAPPGPAFLLGISAGADDAVELADSSVVLNGDGLALSDGNLVGLRFSAVSMPANATVMSAHVQFQAGGSDMGVSPISIRGELSANAAPFAAIAGNLSARQPTSVFVDWSPPAWTAGDSGADQRTVDVAEILEEISQGPGWVSGNAVVLFFAAGDGSRLAESFEAGGSATLEVVIGIPVEPATVSIVGEAIDHSAAFTGVMFDLSTRARTADTVMWSIDPWRDTQSGLGQRTPDLASLIQAIIDDPGWSAGNALTLFFEDTRPGGDRFANSFEGDSDFVAQLVVVALDPASPQIAFDMAVCLPDDLNPNVEPNGTPTEEQLNADCSERVASNIQGLAGSCGYSEICTCVSTLLPNDQDTAYDRSCDVGCDAEELDPSCENFDPANGVNSATHPPGGDPVCLVASSESAGLAADALAGGVFGQVSECQLDGTAQVSVDGLDDRSPAVAARLRIAGAPCPGGSCLITPSFMGSVGAISYDGGFLGAGDTTISEVSISGAGSFEAVLLDAVGEGEIPPGETTSSGRGRRQTNRVIRDDIDVRQSFLSENSDAIAVGVDWLGATCSMQGPLFGGVIGDNDPDDEEEPTESDTTIHLVTEGALINQPPIAIASAPSQVECTSPAGALVHLDGSGGGDPDDNIALGRWNIGSRNGSAVGYGVSAGVPHAIGVSRDYVHRVIDDFGQADEDVVSVEVVDTNPPEIVIPEDLEVECMGPAGTPVHIGRAFAEDLCDTDVIVENDAPDLFPVGETIITWTATDAAGNQVVAMQTVRVVDTTPPEISVDLDPDTLWPANHKMRPIAATIEVVDVCDPNPVVQLVAIVSSEPDDGIGDGATTGDIQNATVGTDDRNFDLRAERKGNGDGRVYTATYQASDAGGNSAEDSGEVAVPKSMGK